MCNRFLQDSTVPFLIPVPTFQSPFFFSGDTPFKRYKIAGEERAVHHPPDKGGQDRAHQLGRDRTEGVVRLPPHHPQVLQGAAVRTAQEGGNNLRDDRRDQPQQCQLISWADAHFFLFLLADSL